MEIASLQVNKFDIRIIRKSIIPQGIHGGTVRLHFQDPIWEGLSKTLVFQGSVARDIVNPGEVVTIPPEVVSTPYCMLMVGVYGVNGEGTIVVPTTWANLGVILPAADPSGDESTDPSLPVWAQILAMIGQMDNLTTQEKSDLVSAINEAASKGSGGNGYILTEEDKQEIAALAAELVDVPESGAVEEERSADLTITGFARANGSFSTATSGLRTDFVSTEGVSRIYGNAGFYASCATIAFYDADKIFLPDISVLGTAFTAPNASYGEGTFELDVSGDEYANAAYFVVSTYRGTQYTENTQTFADDYCRYTILTEGEEAKPYYRIRQNTIAFFGDSITAGIGVGNYPSLIASITGATVTNYGKSGATLATGTSATYHIADLVNAYTGGDDLICISGGINDMNGSVPIGTLTEGYADALDTTTVIGALESIFRKLLTNHTAAKIYYVITHKAASAETIQNSLGLTFADYHDAIVAVLEKYSIPFYDAFSDSGFVTSSHSPWGESMRNLYTVDADGVHPNEAGYLKYYVYPIIAMMERG